VIDGIVMCSLGAGGVVVYYGALATQGRAAARVASGWRSYAERRGFRHWSGTTGFALRVNHRVEGEVSGIRLSCATGLGILGMATTTVSARASVPIEGRLYVSCAETFSLGSEDALAERVVVADPAFDGRLLSVHATRPDLADSVLVGPVRRALVVLAELGHQSLNFRCERDVVAVEWLGVDALPELLDAACDLLVAACRARDRTGIYR
jgi:hypothetical protein